MDLGELHTASSVHRLENLRTSGNILHCIPKSPGPFTCHLPIKTPCPAKQPTLGRHPNKSCPTGLDNTSYTYRKLFNPQNPPLIALQQGLVSLGRKLPLHAGRNPTGLTRTNTRRTAPSILYLNTQTCVTCTLTPAAQPDLCMTCVSKTDLSRTAHRERSVQFMVDTEAEINAQRRPIPNHGSRLSTGSNPHSRHDIVLHGKSALDSRDIRYCLGISSTTETKVGSRNKLQPVDDKALLAYHGQRHRDTPSLLPHDRPSGSALVANRLLSGPFGERNHSGNHESLKGISIRSSNSRAYVAGYWKNLPLTEKTLKKHTESTVNYSTLSAMDQIELWVKSLSDKMDNPETSIYPSDIQLECFPYKDMLTPHDSKGSVSRKTLALISNALVVGSEDVLVHHNNSKLTNGIKCLHVLKKSAAIQDGNNPLGSTLPDLFTRQVPDNHVRFTKRAKSPRDSNPMAIDTRSNQLEPLNISTVAMSEKASSSNAKSDQESLQPGINTYPMSIKEESYMKTDEGYSIPLLNYTLSQSVTNRNLVTTQPFIHHSTLHKKLGVSTNDCIVSPHSNEQKK
ncbi:hypothetical protein BASA50_010654 [Batrachochytrium salamandrivorans]|uniref:Uncharacterized protein n=1 Tax=Batrachochytrium salamandrivorans TaxID=1357716 RepID=A0ABQ8F0V1_9FUNG|nr:hypothetical protein BASA50_010654 [Batrachochytrium salamandrivorans]